MAAATDTTPPIEMETGPTPEASVIWLHGLGADGHDFEPVVPMLGLSDTPAIRFVFPHAPLRAVTINAGMVMRAWYDIVPTAQGFGENAQDVREAEGILRRLIERELERNVAAQNIIVAGFSQGGAIALQTALRYPARLGGLLALSTYIPLATTLAEERDPSNNDIPIFMAHGEFDPLISLSRAQHSQTLLQQLGYAVEWRTYPMPHSVCAQELVDIGRWLNRVLRGERATTT
jgi:phospholipase/carboxylesterase